MLAILSPTDPTPGQIASINGLFEAGLRTFILRMPKSESKAFVRVLNRIDWKYHSRIFVPWGERLLARMFPVGGFYLKETEAAALTEDDERFLRDYRTIIGCHSIEEMEASKVPPSFYLLSPVFDSVSKKGYPANPLLRKMREELKRVSRPVLAMGGVTPENYDSLFNMGFWGAAVIGSVWEDPHGPVHAFEKFSKSAILSIAGQDPSGGAGIDADRETAEHFGFRCFTVPTVVTTQDEGHFESFDQVPEETVLRTVRFLLDRHPEIRGAKIGMISSLSLLRKVLDELKARSVEVIIWDPIVAASKGEKALFDHPDRALLRDCLRDIHIVTPNQREYDYWFDDDTLKSFSGLILIKGLTYDGHLVDVLRTDGGFEWPVSAIPGGTDRHGTGCRYSTAYLCNMLLGDALVETTIRRAQEYVHAYRVSSESALRFDPIERKRRLLKECFSLQYITGDYAPETIEKVLQGGCRWVQLRLKEASTEQRLEALNAVRPLCDRYGAALIIDDDVEAARLGGADGVHLGAKDMPVPEARRYLGDSFIIGATVNDPKAYTLAYASGADYAGIGPFAFTRTKKNLSPLLGSDGIRAIAEENSGLPNPLPLVAIGGITAEDIPEVWETGVDGIAVSGAIERAEDITAYTNNLVTEWERQSQIDTE